ncbi:MAG: phosphotransferase enzyme family protein [Bacteriovoracaceae bacterium]
MASYTAITQKEAEQILSLYGNYQIMELTPLSLGISNSNYQVLLKDHPPLVLKISNDKNTDDLREEQKILNYLSQHHFPHSLVPYLTKKGDLIYEMGSFYGVIYPFISGHIPSISSDICFKIGKSLASLHSLNLQPGASSYVRSFETVGFGAKQIKNYLLQKDCPSDFKAIFEQIFPDQLNKYLKADLPQGLIHGDLYYDNTLFDEQGLKMILDFEQGGMGPYLFDLGVSISGTCLLEGKVHTPYVEAYMKGYSSGRNLDAAEAPHFEEAILLGLYSIALWRIKRFNEKQLAPSKKDNYKELILRAQDYFNRINK